MFGTILPPELCDYTIDFLHDDSAALKKCSLICKAWLPAARFHLFRKVDIHSQCTCDAFYRLLSRAPGLGEIVRQVHVSALHLVSPLRSNARTQNLQPLVMVPPSLFSLIPNIQILTMSALTMTAALHNEWPKSLPSVTQLTLQGCFFDTMGHFIDLFQSFPYLETLALADTRWKSTTTSTSYEPPMKATPLRDLTLGKGLSISCLADWFAEQQVCLKLTSLAASCASREDVTALAELIVQATQLEYCEFHWYGFAPDSRYTFTKVSNQTNESSGDFLFRHPPATRRLLFRRVHKPQKIIPPLSSDVRPILTVGPFAPGSFTVTISATY